MIDQLQHLFPYRAAWASIMKQMVGDISHRHPWWLTRSGASTYHFESSKDWKTSSKPKTSSFIVIPHKMQVPKGGGVYFRRMMVSFQKLLIIPTHLPHRAELDSGTRVGQGTGWVFWFVRLFNRGFVCRMPKQWSRWFVFVLRLK